MTRGIRATQSELTERYRIVTDLIVQGYSGADVWEHVQSNTDWNITRRQSYTYFKKAFLILAEDSNINRASYFKLAIERLELQYKKANIADDYAAASGITMNMVRFLKLDSPDADFDWMKKVSESGVNPDEFKERLKNLLLKEDGEQLESSANGN